MGARARALQDRGRAAHAVCSTQVGSTAATLFLTLLSAQVANVVPACRPACKLHGPFVAEKLELIGDALVRSAVCPLLFADQLRQGSRQQLSHGVRQALGRLSAAIYKNPDGLSSARHLARARDSATGTECRFQAATAAACVAELRQFLAEVSAYGCHRLLPSLRGYQPAASAHAAMALSGHCSWLCYLPPCTEPRLLHLAAGLLIASCCCSMESAFLSSHARTPLQLLSCPLLLPLAAASARPLSSLMLPLNLLTASAQQLQRAGFRAKGRKAWPLPTGRLPASLSR